jgi:tetratricopeptide (TPR) repeat protein
MMQGRYGEALDYSKRLRRNVDGAIDDMPMLAPYGSFEWMVLTRFGKWKEMLAEAEPKDKAPVMHAYYRYARGLAFAGLGQVPDAQAERERLGAACARIPEDQTLMINNTRSVLAIGMEELDARIARAGNDAEAEIAHLRKAVELQDKLGYMEPPEWHYPVREALGGALLRHGRAAEAEAVFRRDLEINPRNGRSLFGLLQALKAQNKTNGVEWVKREFADAWKYSGTGLEIARL